jgi:hypothetical protein
VKRVALEDKAYILDWVAARVGGHPGNTAVPIGLVDDETGDLVAGVFYHDWSGPNIVMAVAGTGSNWMTREYLRYCFYYPFVQLDCERITALIDEYNQASINLVKRLGFVEEARLHRAAKGGFDLIIFVLWRDKCRWHKLEVRNNGQVERSRGTGLPSSGPSAGRAEQGGGVLPECSEPPERVHA